MTADKPRTDADEPTPAERLAEADRRMADADALLEIASAQLSVAARNIANANAAEREYRRATWHYTQLMKHRIATPLQTIIGMADTLRDMPDLERSRRVAMVEAIGQQARSLRELCLTADTFEEPAVSHRPAPLDRAVRDLGRGRESDPLATTPIEPAPEQVPVTNGGEPDAGERPLPDPPGVLRFRRSSDRDKH
jgi:hypothetical protein